MKRATGHLSGAIEYERADTKRDCSVAGSMESPNGGVAEGIGKKAVK